MVSTGHTMTNLTEGRGEWGVPEFLWVAPYAYQEAGCKVACLQPHTIGELDPTLQAPQYIAAVPPLFRDTPGPFSCPWARQHQPQQAPKQAYPGKRSPLHAAVLCFCYEQTNLTLVVESGG